MHARQLALDLQHRAALGREDFLVSDCNAAAVAAIDAWPDWPHSGLVLAGPAGSGKTHLVEVWRQQSGARAIQANEIRGDPGALLDGLRAIVIENCGPGIDETALFHLLNAAERLDADVLLTATSELQGWSLSLSDLKSRLNRLPVVVLEPPDDVLLQALMIKLFSDRQIEVGQPVLTYLARRVERSFAAVRDMVERLDRAAIEEKRPVTRALAARILNEINDEAG